MNTKASSILMMIFEVLVVILVISITLQIATNYAQSAAIQKINLAEELTLMVNTLTAVPGDVLVEYPHDASQYTFFLKSDGITVSLPDDAELQKVRRSFHLPQGYSADGFLEGKKRLCLEKKGRGMIVRECS